jgi:hypothetical protein
MKNTMVKVLVICVGPQPAHGIRPGREGGTYDCDLHHERRDR